MKYATGVFLLLCCFITDFESTPTKWCTKYRQHTEQVTTACGFWWQKRCHKYYKYRRVSYQACCDGYGGSNCYPKCGGRTNENEACNTTISSGRLVKKDGGSVTSSGGTCERPYTCSGCNKGFYPTSYNCTVCPEIANCDYEECTNAYDATCSICSGEHGPDTCHGCNAFRKSRDKKRCIELCSWRYTCWPGQCGARGYKSDCRCHHWFAGEKCMKITKPPSILHAGVKLIESINGGQERTLIHNNPNEVIQARVYWTNENVSRIKINASAQWKTKLPAKPKYISPYKSQTDIIVSGKLKVIYQQANGLRHEFNSVCSSSKDESKCMAGDDLAKRFDFKHGGSISTQIDYDVGGFVTIIYPGLYWYWQPKKHNFISATSRFKLTFRWDLMKPYNNDPGYLTLSTEKVTTVKQSITAYWQGWRDDDAKLTNNVTVGINLLKRTDDKLQDPCEGTAGTESVPYYRRHQTLNVSKPGVYSVILTVSDAAGNHERARAFFTYDPDSVITIKSGTSITINGAVNNGAITWLNDLHMPVNMTYSKGRFINHKHTHGNWLGLIQSCHGMSNKFDGTTGTRTTQPIRNNQGVVKMEIGFGIVNQPNFQIRYSDVDIFSTQSSFNMQRADGDIMKLSIKVTDYMGRFLVENMTLGTDSTPPVINDVWLTRNGARGLMVHTSEDLRSMVFEWEAYDFHSGLREISWAIYDNETDPNAVIYHGNQSVGHQGLHKNLDTCKSEYANRPHGQDCYCVTYLGCFHKDFFFKPFVSVNNGLHPNRTKGQHAGEYFVEITAKNWAMLESKVTVKVTIDTSPRRSGTVFDGSPGEPDVDYQSSRSLTAHWDGFFVDEREMAYYQFAWGTKCADARIFGITYDKAKVENTTKSFTLWTAPTAGRYFITVVACNAALDHSYPVCSNGVTVDETGPVFDGLTVENTKTIPGLVKENGSVYFVGVDRTKLQIRNPSKLCVIKATNTTDITIYPDSKFANGTLKTERTDFCEDQNSLSLTSYTQLTKDLYISANWTAHDEESGIAGYQFGLMTNPTEIQAPDILPFEETNFGSIGHVKRFHPGLSAGTVFYIGLKAINNAMLITTKVFGPFVVEVTAPSFTGKITVQAVHGEFLSTWNPMDFSDAESASPLKFKVAVGTTRGGTNVIPWTALSPGAGCQLISPPGCTYVNTKSSSRQLHAGDSYYLSIKATNFVGLSVVATSDVVQHVSDPPAMGVVIDVTPTYARSDEPLSTLADDIDYQLNTTSLKVSWHGFDIPYHATNYRAAVGTSPGGQDVASSREVTGSSYQFDGLNLSAFKTYYSTIWARNGYGEIHVSSDGVKVLRANVVINANVYDGLGSCSAGINTSTCGRDVDYQASVSSLSAHWSIPNNMAPYITVVLWKIEQQNDVMDSTSWVTFEPFLTLPLSYSVTKANLGLVSGKRYRSVLRFCHGDICFDDAHSDGVLVLANPPAAGTINVEYQEPKTIKVLFDRFVDADIPELYTYLSRSVIDVYEWTIAAGNAPGQHIANWRKTEINVTKITKAQFVAVLDHPLTFKTCYRIVLRGVSKAGLSTTISKEIKACNDIKWLAPVIIDAYGQPVLENGIPLTPRKSIPIAKELNEPWLQPDRDFTPYANMLSAIWPSLRHGDFTYAVIMDRTLSTFSHYHRPDKMVYKDPCSLPTAIKCGNTGKDYVNIEFEVGALMHGVRYYICIHANAVNRNYEDWTETLAEVNMCSDGITLDLTDPKPGNVWFGRANVKESLFHTSKTELVIHWSAFLDVEEEGMSPFETGIKYYEYAIGTRAGVPDIVNFTNVGITDHAMLHGLKLQDGHTYYAMIKATDYVNRTTTAISTGVTVDTTPPIRTAESFKSEHNGTIAARWDGVFSDPESDISHYEWSVGSAEGYADITPYTKTNQTSAFTGSGSNLHDGRVYYMSVKAFNKAGLSSLVTALTLLNDASPPVKGYVFDGRRDQATMEQKDKDFQSDANHIWAYWEGFNDPHSGITSYTWSVGTCVGCGDVLKDHPLGTNTDATATHFEVTPRQGHTYYVTVTACNAVGLCTSASSDGVLLDNTTPIAGSVQDGVDLVDCDYQMSRDNVGAKWWGFLDPHSGISHYSWWIGTTPGGDDLMKEGRLHHTEMAFLSQLPGGVRLPIDKDIYITVGATNHVGLSSNATSNGFKVVTSSPTIVQQPTHLDSIGSVYKNTQIMGTVFGATFKFTDTNCPIKEQYISLKVDGNQRREIPTVQLGSTVSSYYFTDVRLRDGTRYFVSVTACNMAKRCNTSISETVLVDNTPPLTGGFKDAKDFAWNSTTLSFSLTGFIDIHSGMKHYDVGVGGSYGARDITNERLIGFHHVPSKKGQPDGNTQSLVLTGNNITKSLTSGMNIYVSVTGINGVGLESDVVQKKFRLLAGGGLSLIKQCEADLCDGHCACSPQNMKCPRSTNNCSITESDAVNLTVFDVLDIREHSPFIDVDFSPSTCVMAARWKLDPLSKIRPISYDVAVGLASESEPDGVQMKGNIIWRNVGLSNHAIHTRGDHDQYLFENAKYSFFIKAWISKTEFKIFKSDGVYTSARPPALAKKQAAHVKDCRPDEVNKGTLNAKDVDLYNRSDYFCVSWKNAFMDKTTDHWEKYFVSLSTFPGGEDIRPNQESLSSFMEFLNLSLTPGRRYYSNVRACNRAGLCNERHSDGVIIDLEPPLAGIVLDGPGLHDEEYQNRTHLLAAHWNGFVDLGSAIHYHMWCVGTTQEPDECKVWPWTNVGLHTRIRKSVKSPLPGGRTIYNKVYAVDAAGHRSPVAVSNGVTVDTTPPVILTKLKFGDNLVNNPSFEEDDGISMAALANFTSTSSPPRIKGWNVNNSATAHSVSVNAAALSRDGRQFLLLHGSLYQELVGLVVGERYIVELYVSQLAQSRKPTQSGRIGTIRLPDRQEYLFNGRNKSDRHETTHWIKHIYYFKAGLGTGNITLSSNGPMNVIAIDDVSIKHVQDGQESQPISQRLQSSMHVQYVFTDDWMSLHVAWEFEDKESPIVEYKLAVGTRIGDSRLYGYKSVALNTFAQLSKLSLTHDSTVFVTVIARNAAGLSSYLASGGIKVDMTPPVIHYVWDGDKEGEDISFQDTKTVTAQWKATDPESGIRFCEYGIGATPGSVAIQPFHKVQRGAMNISQILIEPIPPVIYTTIRCHNFAGGTTTMTSNGVGITLSKPSIKNAMVKILTNSETVYPNQQQPGSFFQSQTDILILQWNGFEDPSGIAGYEIKVIGKGVWDQVIPVPDGGMTYMKVTDLGMLDGNTYLIEVRAVNGVGKRSDKVSTKVTIMRQPPTLIGSAANLQWVDINKTFTMDWSTLFKQESVFSYEVSLGTIQGGADIKQWLETKSSNMTFELESAWQTRITFHSTITAVNSAGLYTTTVYPIVRNAIKSRP